MDFPDEAKGQRQLLQSIESVLHGPDVVSNFLYIVIFGSILGMLHLLD